jgi:hypothetical protein
MIRLVDEETILGRYDNGRAQRDKSAREAREAVESYREWSERHRARRRRMLLTVGAFVFAFFAGVITWLR